MSIQEKLNLVNLFSLLLILTLYCLYIYQIHPEISLSTEIDYKFWGRTFLLLIPIQLGSNIFINIIFSIIYTVATKEETDYKSDELGKLIALTATRNGFYVFIFGFFLAMLLLVLNVAPFVIFHVLGFSLFAMQIVWLASELYFYQKGI